MIVYSRAQRGAMDPDLRYAQARFDAVVVAALTARLFGGVESLEPVVEAGPLAQLQSGVQTALELHPDDLGLAFGALVEYADHWGFSVHLLDEDAPQWVNANRSAMASAA